MRAGPGADVIEPGSGRSGPALGAADRPVPRMAGRGGGGPVDGGDAGDAALDAGSGVSVRPGLGRTDTPARAARAMSGQLSRRMARMRRNST